MLSRKCGYRFEPLLSCRSIAIAMTEVPRMRPRTAQTNPVEGRPVWSPVKSIWFSAMTMTALIGGPLTFSFDAAAVACGMTIVTLCLGHSIGFHRLLIHRSFECPRWLEYSLVYLGVLVGMGGPRRMVFLHDIRDWSQRHPRCHRFFIHRSRIWVDWFWQMHCKLKLVHAPEFQPDESITRSRFYRFLDRTWMLQQLPIALMLFAFGGWSWVVWGICVRVTISLTGHWLVGYIAHNAGSQQYIVEGASTQGYNIPALGLITMGEAWHNNHHAFPESARLGLTRSQLDPGWWVLSLLRRIGLIWNVRLKENLPPRDGLVEVDKTPAVTR